MSGMKAIALKNRLKAKGNFEFALKNIRVNSDVRGCSGFVKNLDNGKIIYVTTEISVYGPLSQKVMYRVASSFKDFTGERNQWAQVKDEQFIDDMVAELKK